MSRRRPGLVRPILQLAAAIALGVAARDKRVRDADEQVRALVVSRRSSTLDRVLPAATDLGSTYAVAGAAAVLWAAGRKRLARDVAAAGGIAWCVAQVMKLAYRRARPYDATDVELLVRRPAGTSYPSGHPAVAAAVARVAEPDLERRARRLIARIPRFVGFSRIYVGAHYPTDVIGGLLIGRAVADLWRRYGDRIARSRVPATTPRAR